MRGREVWQSSRRRWGGEQVWGGQGKISGKSGGGNKRGGKGGGQGGWGRAEEGREGKK
jgi:hypothetical protein